SDALDGVWNSDKIRIPAFLDERMTIQILRILILATCGALFIWIGDLVRCDYGGKGIRLIMIFYLLRQYRSIACVVGYSSFMWEAYCFPAFLLIPFYNGRRGAGKKYVFYLFYPVHIIALYFIRKVFLSYVG
ncbi:MAG: hypothetical protein J6P60_01445, partial [Lachnospiraceae bacterium]|nr:hypothetical protein [Lachnospiraceae bacterium]